MGQMVENCVRKCQNPDHGMPPVNGNLACADQVSIVVALLDDFEEVACLIGKQ